MAIKQNDRVVEESVAVIYDERKEAIAILKRNGGGAPRLYRIEAMSFDEATDFLATLALPEKPIAS